MSGIVIRDAEPSDLDEVRRLFRDYEQELGVDLCFQSFEDELQGLPGRYAPPRGGLLVAERSGELVGVVGLRGLDNRQCEMKRMYVAPTARGEGLGKRLAEAILERAATLGYQAMVLDTLERMGPAVALYRSLGFVDIGDYYGNTLPDAVFLRKDLTGS